MKNILDLNHDEVKNIFLNGESFFSLELPRYFNFNKLLKEISDNLLGDYKLIKKDNPDNFSDVNYKLYNNKDGKFDWRPFQIMNPVVYISLINSICEEENWNLIKNRIEEIKQKSKIKCISMPVVNDENNHKKGDQIKNWWNNIEQESIKKSLDYEYIFHTDIVDCYASIYTHSIPWALHTKEVAKRNRSDSLLGNKIDRHLRAMSYGQTNGIPQGSLLMDFIAEILLYYVDDLISKKLEGVENYYILRYRDDYKIFTNNSCQGNEIIKIIAQELSELGLKLNSIKTNYFNNVIHGAIKSDKIKFLKIPKNNNLQKRLLILHNFSLENPNSSVVKVELSKIKKNLDKKNNYKKENIEVLIAILTDIAYKNTRTYVEVSAILSNLFEQINDIDLKKEIIKKVFTKLKKVINTGYFEIWFQRVILKENIEIDFDEKLCKLVNGSSEKIWDNSWINSAKILKILNDINIVDAEEKENMPELVEEEEIRVFDLGIRFY